MRNLLGAVLFVTLLLTGIIWLSQSLRFIELIVNRGLPISKFIYLSTLLLPSLLSIMLPAALFIGVLYTYNKLINDSELVVMESAGLSYWQIAKPAIAFSAAIMIVGYFVSLVLLPLSYREFKDMQTLIRDKYASIFLQEEVFNSPVDGLTVYIGKLGRNGVLEKIFVHDNRNKKSPITMMAREGRLVQTPTGPRFDLLNGSRQEVDKENSSLSMLYFESYGVDLNLFTGANKKRSLEPQERFIHQLFSTTPDMSEEDIRKMKAEAHQRLTWPLHTMTLGLIALCFLIGSEFNRRGMVKKIVFASIVGACEIALAMTALNLTYKNSSFAILIYLNIAIFLTGGCIRLIKMHNPKPSNGLKVA